MVVLNIDQVAERTSLGRTAIYEAIAGHGFPKPVPLVGRRVGWIESEVDAWIESRARSPDREAAWARRSASMRRVVGRDVAEAA